MLSRVREEERRNCWNFAVDAIIRKNNFRSHGISFLQQARRRVLLESGSERRAGFVKMMRGPLIVEIRRFSLLVSDKNVERKICLFRLL